MTLWFIFLSVLTNHLIMSKVSDILKGSVQDSAAKPVNKCGKLCSFF